MTFPYDENTYEEWDFEEIWAADTNGDINNGYPYIRELTVSVDDNDRPLPAENIKLANYPNPFNPQTTIHFTLPQQGNVSLIVYNIKGQRIKTLLNEPKQSGEHRIVWNGRDEQGRAVPTGLYLYRLRAGRHDKVRKMLSVQ